MKKTELVFVPSPGIGHVESTVEFAKCLLGRDETLVITILTMKAPSVPNLESYSEEVAASNTNIRLITLPPVDPPPSNFLKSPENYLTLLMESHKSHVKDAIIKKVLQKSTTSLAGLVIHMFCSSMIDVANELEIPSYVFFTSSAAFLAIMLHLPIHYSQTGREFNLSDPDSIILGFMNPVPARVLPSFVFNQEGGYKSFLNHALRFKETKGIFINTILELESNAIESLKSKTETPPIYTVGPLLNLSGRKEPDSQHERIMKWLDDQPPSSVVFLCFGSLGTVEKPQLMQTANALEQSGHKFLWSIRQAPSRRDISDIPSEYTNLSEALPEGFIERTENRGLVCGWAPQVEVLAHQAVGRFVSHCGWNSILESVWHGVPIVTWPIYAEQQTNAFQLVMELGFAMELTLDYRIENGDKHVIMAAEIEKAIRCLMHTQTPVRMKAKEMEEISRTAMKNGGSSFVSIDRLIADILVNKR